MIRDRLAAGGDITRGATIVAGWARFATGVGEQGESFEAVDHLGDALREAAARDVREPGAFLSCAVFGDLAEDERLVAAYRTAIRTLRERGVRAALASARGG